MIEEESDSLQGVTTPQVAAVVAIAQVEEDISQTTTAAAETRITPAAVVVIPSRLIRILTASGPTITITTPAAVPTVTAVTAMEVKIGKEIKTSTIDAITTELKVMIVLGSLAHVRTSTTPLMVHQAFPVRLLPLLLSQ